MPHERDPPMIIPAFTAPSDPSKAAAFIFVHGLGDNAEGVEAIPRQFQAANKLPHLTWVIPNACENRDVGTTAWYAPTRLSPYPPSRPELEDDEDEDGMLQTVSYLTTLIDDLVAQGIPANRIVLGGFSQGHAMAFLTGLISAKYAGRLAGLVGLSGYLPLIEKIPDLREKAGLTREVGSGEEVSYFLARGTADRLVPRRFHRMGYEALYSLGVKEDKAMLKEYEGMGHSMAGAELRDLCGWLENVVPDEGTEVENTFSLAQSPSLEPHRSTN